MAKKEPWPVKNSAIPEGRRHCRKDCPFLLDTFLLGKQKKSIKAGQRRKCQTPSIRPDINPEILFKRPIPCCVPHLAKKPKHGEKRFEGYPINIYRNAFAVR